MLRSYFDKLLLVPVALLLGANASAQATTVYSDEAAFLAAVDSPTLTDFEGIAQPDVPEFLEVLIGRTTAIFERSFSGKTTTRA